MCSEFENSWWLLECRHISAAGKLVKRQHPGPRSGLTEPQSTLEDDPQVACLQWSLRDPASMQRSFPASSGAQLVSGPRVLRRPTSKNPKKGPLLWVNAKRACLGKLGRVLVQCGEMNQDLPLGQSSQL